MPKTATSRRILNAQYPTGFFNTTAFGGTSFDITADGSGNNFAGIESTPLTISVNMPDVTDVYTLLNGFAPNANQTGETVTFDGTGGASQTFTLTNGVDVRDFYQGNYASTINGTTTQNVFSVVNRGGAGTTASPQTSNVSTGFTGTYVLDAQHFTLDSVFVHQTLTSITVANGSGSLDSILSGVTVTSSASPAPEVPEAGSLSLLGIGLGGLLLRARRKGRAA